MTTSLAKEDSANRKKRSATEAGIVSPQRLNSKMIKRESLPVIKEEEEVSIVKRSVTYEGSIPQYGFDCKGGSTAGGNQYRNYSSRWVDDEDDTQ